VADSDHSFGEVINIGRNYETSIGETASIIAQIMKVDIEIESDPQRVRPENREVERLWADNRKANKLTGWVPASGSVKGLKTGCRKRWHGL